MRDGTLRQLLRMLVKAEDAMVAELVNCLLRSPRAGADSREKALSRKTWPTAPPRARAMAAEVGDAGQDLGSRNAERDKAGKDIFDVRKQPGTRTEVEGAQGRSYGQGSELSPSTMPFLESQLQARSLTLAYAQQPLHQNRNSTPSAIVCLLTTTTSRTSRRGVYLLPKQRRHPDSYV